MIPMGQPILVGHHSEGRHRRDLERHDRDMRKAIEHGQNAGEAARRSESVRGAAEARESPVVMARKVARLQAEQRQLTRLLRDGTGEYAERLHARQRIVEEDVAFLQEAIERSGAPVYTRADIQSGDLVQLGRRGWQLVVKANPKTVAVKTPYTWTDKYPYHEITGHRRPEGQSGGAE